MKDSELTWNKMFEYLKSQKNCIVEEKEFKVLNLHETLKRFKTSIDHFEPQHRATNLNCKNLKSILTRIYKLHKQNKFKIILDNK